MKFVTLINRTSKNLEGVWDGKHFTVEPGKNQFPEIVAAAIKRQNPLMGSENPYTLGEMEYLVGIEEQGDDVSPLEQSDSIERWDRRRLSRDVKVVPGINGMFAQEVRQPLTPTMTDMAFDPEPNK